MKIVRMGPESVVNTLHQLPGQLTRLQSKAIAQIYADHKNRRAALVLEELRLAAQYGARSEQARLAQAKIDRFDAAGVALAAEFERSILKSPDPDPKGFVVYGRVLDRSGSGVPGLTVSAIGPNEAVLGETKTSGPGEFSITAPVDRDISAAGFHLKVSDGQGKTLLSPTEILVPTASQLAYRELIVNVSAAASKP
jgi:hypothetical protein